MKDNKLRIKKKKVRTLLIFPLKWRRGVAQLSRWIPSVPSAIVGQVDPLHYIMQHLEKLSVNECDLVKRLSAQVRRRLRDAAAVALFTRQAQIRLFCPIRIESGLAKKRFREMRTAKKPDPNPVTITMQTGNHRAPACRRIKRQ